MADSPQPLLLVGAQRSGTTALGHALSTAYARAGGCFTVNGKLFYLAARWIHDSDLAARHVRVDELCHALDRRPAGGVDAEQWRRRVEVALRAAAAGIADNPGGSAVTLVRAVASAAYGDGPWGDKYNEYLLDLAYLHRLYPEARWLFVYRHPAEVAASMLAWTGDRPWRPGDLAGCELKWAEWNERWLAFRDQVAPELRRELSYHTLCTDEGLREVSRFAGAELASGCMSPGHSSPPRQVHTRQAADVWERLSGRSEERCT